MSSRSQAYTDAASGLQGLSRRERRKIIVEEFYNEIKCDIVHCELCERWSVGDAEPLCFSERRDGTLKVVSAKWCGHNEVPIACLNRKLDKTVIICGACWNSLPAVAATYPLALDSGERLARCPVCEPFIPQELD